MLETIQAKTMLSTVKKDPMFGLRYNMNLYRGCQHGCIYCDSRSTCYGIKNFSQIQIKENAIELLEKEIPSKRTKGTIGTGAMNDPYMPIEKEVQMTRKALEVIAKHRFPVHIMTKGDLVTRDIDILEDISKTYAAVSMTITTADDQLASWIEPHAPSSSKRFEAMERLSRNGIYTGVLLMPVLPFITDQEENIREIVRRSKIAGTQYIIAWFGMTLREGQREYFYRGLDRQDLKLKEKYKRTYGYAYGCAVPEYKKLYSIFKETCDKLRLPRKMRFYQEEASKQMSFFDGDFL
ncbi:DNA repair photolyase [Anaerosolibacter carboniphilus]|uniref:DNA repair photolyase n=1 Tax=Anaerosolibacter carboniphilus TaxID=1417629 RepID=A0A841KKG6_9FIRM|nr:radical SAM protein [Anaerosolibacter carboniphilus]MBB6214364.1 DNA repair photolyase [Anaerosolibacter carboniphilus]